jgi:hypothetical protein
MRLCWCMECQTKVELNKQGRCEICDSEGVDLLFAERESSLAVSTTPEDSDPAPSGA